MWRFECLIEEATHRSIEFYKPWVIFSHQLVFHGGAKNL
jgi:hypothetical protein